MVAMLAWPRGRFNEAKALAIPTGARWLQGMNQHAFLVLRSTIMALAAPFWTSMTDLSLTILPEADDDAAAIERLHERTFGPGRFAKSAYRLRERISHRLELSFTARVRTLLVGS